LERTKEYLPQILKTLGTRDYFYEMLADEVDITIGTAMAAFS
jgi:hypothetical protein